MRREGGVLSVRVVLAALVLVWGCEAAERAANGSQADMSAAADVGSAADGSSDASPGAGCQVSSECGAPTACGAPSCGADGRCVVRSLPDGTPCSPDDACAAEGRCSQGLCVATAQRDGCACPALSCSPGQVRRDVDGDGCLDCVDCAADAECPSGQRCVASCGVDQSRRCQPTPLACPADAGAVCGCDGVSYAGACAAARAGVSVASNGPCACDGACLGAAFCEASDASCGAGSQCTPVPSDCPAGGTPVCGCDQRLYGNDCLRRAARVALARATECGCEPLQCPPGSAGVAAGPSGCATQCVPCPALSCPAGAAPADADNNGCADSCTPAPCNLSTPCPEGAYCARLACAAAGVCRPTPESCPADASAGPVCGCDGATFVDACAAAAAGESVAHDGACALGCTVGGADCPDGSGCEPSACGAQDGLCVPDAACLGGAECGCDGKTYPSACARRDAGVGLAHTGSCACTPLTCAPGAVPVPPAAGLCPKSCEPAPCTSDAACPDAATGLVYCDRAASGAPTDCAGAGLCRPKPDTCGASTGSVCGCDGVTYASACEAGHQGISVASAGACVAGCGADGGCPAGLVCSQCDVFGLCTDAAALCASASAELSCGCDGRTWGSQCERAQAGVGLQHLGACVCGSNSDCVEGQQCVRASCGASAGVCQTRPVACGTGGNPVCDCAGVSYPNACSALLAGRSPVPCAATCKPITCAAPLVPRDTNGDLCPDACLKCPALSCPQGSSPVDTTADGCPDLCVQVCLKAPPDCGGALPIDTDKDGCVDACCKEPLCDVPPIDSDGDGCADLCPCLGPVCKGAQVAVDVTGDGCADSCACPIAPTCAPPRAAVDVDGDSCLDACACPAAPACAPGSTAVDGDGDGCLDSCKCTATPSCQLPFTAQDTNQDGCADACLCKPFVCTAPKVAVDAAGGDGCLDTCACPALLCPAQRLPRDLDKDGCPDACVCPVKPVCGAGFVAHDADLDGCPESCVCAPPVCSAGTRLVDTDADGCADSCAQCPSAPVCTGSEQLVDKDKDSCPDGCAVCPPLPCAASESAFDIDRNGCPETCAPTACDGSVGCGSDALVCVRPTGSCGGSGKCQLRPTSCASASGTVCGCDGSSYTSACAAAQKGVAVSALGVCCVAPVCGSAAKVTDRDGDGCAESCVCGDGRIEAADHCGACPAVPACPSGVPALDTDGDGCPESCVCPSDKPLSPAGCGAPTCKSGFVCSGMSSKQWLVDRTGDGCYDAIEACPEGTHGEDAVGDGCHNICVP